MTRLPTRYGLDLSLRIKGESSVFLETEEIAAGRHVQIELPYYLLLFQTVNYNLRVMV